MKRFFTLQGLLFFCLTSVAQGNYVFSGGEAVNFGVVDLSTPGGQIWGTDRLAIPGYFSAVIGATYTGASDAANINGYMKKYGNEAFVYPVGSGTDLRTIGISAPVSSTDVYATAWIAGDPGGNTDPTSPNAGSHPVTARGSGIIAVNPVGQWDWQAISGTGAGLTITVSIPDMTLFGAASNLRLVGWDGTMWINLGISGASSNTENNMLSGTMQTGITAIAIGSVDVVLPLHLISFSAVQQDCGAALHWLTENEINTDHFDIEESTDGVMFTKTGTVNASNNSSGYNFFVAQKPALAYYRLKIIDTDGSFSYSPVNAIRIHCSGANYFTIYPNPVITGNGEITLRFKADYQGHSLLQFIDNTGRQLMSRAIEITNGNNTLRLNTTALPAGIYYLRLTDEKGKLLTGTEKFIKLK